MTFVLGPGQEAGGSRVHAHALCAAVGRSMGRYRREVPGLPQPCTSREVTSHRATISIVYPAWSAIVMNWPWWELGDHRPASMSSDTTRRASLRAPRMSEHSKPSVSWINCSRSEICKKNRAIQQPHRAWHNAHHDDYFQARTNIGAVRTPPLLPERRAPAENCKRPPRPATVCGRATGPREGVAAGVEMQFLKCLNSLLRLEKTTFRDRGQRAELAVLWCCSNPASA